MDEKKIKEEKEGCTLISRLLKDATDGMEPRACSPMKSFIVEIICMVASSGGRDELSILASFMILFRDLKASKNSDMALESLEEREG